MYVSTAMTVTYLFCSFFTDLTFTFAVLIAGIDAALLLIGCFLCCFVCHLRKSKKRASIVLECNSRTKVSKFNIQEWSESPACTLKYPKGWSEEMCALLVQ